MRKKYNEEDYIKKCKELGLEYIGYYKGKRNDTMIQFICPKHRDKGVQSKDWGHFRMSVYGCTYCSGRNKTNEDIIPLIKNKDVELVSEYKGNEKPITCKCKKCGNVWVTIPKVLITNGSGCPKCGKEKSIKGETKTKEQFINELSLVNDNIIVLGDYVNTHTKIKCECKICGTIWEGYPANLLNESAGCPTCNLSKGERRLLSILKKYQINHISQHKIEGCRYKSELKFDAFAIDDNIAFEYNGEQHYFPVDFVGKGEQWAKEQFEIVKIRDNIKINFCKENNIPLIIIPYWEFDNMEYYILDKLKEVQKHNQ